MAIDRIGTGSAPPLPSPVASTLVTTRRAFAVDAPTAPAAATSAPLAQVRVGQVDRDAYVRRRIDDATVHLDGMAPQKLEAIRSALADSVAVDPALRALVERACRD